MVVLSEWLYAEVSLAAGARARRLIPRRRSSRSMCNGLGHCVLLLAARRAWNPPAWLVTRIDRRRAIHLDTEGCAARRCNCKSSMRLHSGANLRAKTSGIILIFGARCGAPSMRVRNGHASDRELLCLDLDQSITCPHVQGVVRWMSRWRRSKAKPQKCWPSPASRPISSLPTCVKSPTNSRALREAS